MIVVSPASKIFICTEFIDFRVGIDSLKEVVVKKLKMEPMNRAIFAFINKSRTSLKFITYDGQGYWLMQKRLSMGKFVWWPSSAESCSELDAKNFLILINNGDPTQIRLQADWKKI